jgi:2-C-methyl-D-erythritol 4-phosphate cytidylyltransferase
MTAMETLWCVVPAAGSGRRFGGETPKQYLPLHGKPMLVRTLERLAACREIGGLMVVLAADDAHWPRLSNVAGKPVHTAIGGAERSVSVLAGLEALPAEVAAEAFVLVHDAARPCVAASDIARLVALGIPAGGALLASPLRDTLKRSDADGHVTATEPRERLWRAQTPQMFRRGELSRALAAAHAQGLAITDESLAMEHAGRRPLLVEGAEDNIKVTTPADLALAEFLLRRTEE